MAERPRIILGMSGASGSIYGVRLLEAFDELDIECHLVISGPGAITLASETDETPAALEARAHASYRNADIAAPIASGSFATRGMIIAPCSVRTMSEIATGVTSSLMTRAADVILKERKPLVLMVRETPFHLGHLRTMTALAEMGAIIFPPLPAFYVKPESIDDIVDQSVGRALDLFGFEWERTRRWGEDVGPGGDAST